MQIFNSLFNPITDRARRAAAADSVWATWTYDAETWRRYDEWAWKRALQRNGFFLLIGFVWALIVGALFQFLLPPTHSVIIDLFFRFAPLWVIFMTLLWTAITFRRSLIMHKGRQRGPATIRIGPLTVEEPGDSFTIAGGHAMIGLDPITPPMHTLRVVKLKPGSPLLLQFQGWGARNWPTSVNVPVPMGGEAAAEALIARFQQEILGKPA